MFTAPNAELPGITIGGTLLSGLSVDITADQAPGSVCLVQPTLNAQPFSTTNSVLLSVVSVAISSVHATAPLMKRIPSSTLLLS